MSKFKPHNEFDKSGKEYSLLPFRFAEVHASQYLLTNEVGETLVVERSELEQFANHELSSETDLYQNLQSKHFLINADSSVALDLLALKLRTKLSRLSQFTALHLFVVSLRCEHSCPYCQVSRQSDDREAFDMSIETAEKALDLVFRSPAPSIKIEFQGGEPLLNFELVKFIVNRALEINKVKQRTLGFVIATNLAVLTDEVLQFCQMHDVHISTSLDGPAALHNANRPRPGKNSYELAIQGIERARITLGRDRVSALMTTTKASLPCVKEIIDEYVGLDFSGIFLRPLSPYGFAVKTKWFAAYDVTEWLKFYFEGLDYILELNRSGLVFREFMALTILRKMLTPFETGYVDLMSPAGIGIAAVVYNYNGEVFASDESRMLAEMGDKTFCLGNVHSSSYEQIFTSEALLNPLEQSFARSAPMCTDCAFEPFCGSEPVYHYATQQDFVGHKPSSGFCQRNTAVFKRLIELMQNPETRDIFLRWMN